MSFHDDELHNFLIRKRTKFLRIPASEVDWLFDKLQQNLLKIQEADLKSGAISIAKGMDIASLDYSERFSLGGPIFYFGDMLTEYIYLFSSADLGLLEELRSIPEVGYLAPLFGSSFYRIDFHGGIEAFKIPDDLSGE